MPEDKNEILKLVQVDVARELHGRQVDDANRVSWVDCVEAHAQRVELAVVVSLDPLVVGVDDLFIVVFFYLGDLFIFDSFLPPLLFEQ